MINIEDRNYAPSLEEIQEMVGNQLFDEVICCLKQEYNPRITIEYSGDNILLGWNVKLKKAGKTLCTLYPRKDHFFMLLVVGRKEKERVEELLPSFSLEFQNIYRETTEGMGQRWLLLDFKNQQDTYGNALSVIKIRRESK